MKTMAQNFLIETMSGQGGNMCLDEVYDKPKRKWGVGIKLCEKYRGGYRGFWWEMTEDKKIYRMGNTYQDKNTYTLFTTKKSKKRGYLTGYHVVLDENIIRSNWSDREATFVKVRFSKVVAQGHQQCFGKVVVARQITLLEEIKT